MGSSLSTECPVLGTTSSCDPGICAATSRAFAVGVRRSSAPLRISVGTSGSGALSGAGAGVVNGQNAHAGTSLTPSTSAGGERRERAAAPSARTWAPASARRPRGEAARFHGKAALFAGGRVVEGRVEALGGAFRFAPFAALGSLEQPRERGRVAARRGAHRRGEFGAQGRFQIALEQDFEQLVGGDRDRVGVAAAVDPARTPRGGRAGAG